MQIMFRGLRKARHRVQEWTLSRRMRRQLGGMGICFLSSNCVGSRLSLLAGEPFNSPTVNLWMAPGDFLQFVERIEDYKALGGDFQLSDTASTEHGYPVADLGGETGLPRIRVYFQHFHSLDEAVSAWTRRFNRLDLDRVVLTFTDRDGATEEDLRRFDALPYVKIAFTSRTLDGVACAVQVPGYEHAAEVGDLFSDWQQLAAPLTSARLRALSDALREQSATLTRRLRTASSPSSR
jgi:uncharacterized protein (DUF1919 family)